MLEEQIAQLRQAMLVQRDRQAETLELLKRRQQELEAVNTDRAAQVTMLEEQIAQLRQAMLVQRDRQEAMNWSLAHLREIERSRGYRVLRGYYALFDSQRVGPSLRWVRKLGGRVVHAIR